MESLLSFLDHDDKLHPHALAAVVANLNEDKDLDIFIAMRIKSMSTEIGVNHSLNQAGARIFFCLKIIPVISQFTERRL